MSTQTDPKIKKQPQWLSLAMLSLILIGLTVNRQCEIGYVLSINDDNEEECFTCGENCMTCLLMENRKPNCFVCNEGFFLDKSTSKHSCQPCAEGCGRCVGSTLSKCSETLPSFFYNSKTHNIGKCGDGCHRCFSPTECSVCADEFYSDTNRLEEVTKDNKSKDKKKLDLGEKYRKLGQKPHSVTCLPCGIKDCQFCESKPDQIKNKNFLSCDLCKSRFALVNEKCEKCPENCEYCRDQTKECIHCSTGYQWNKTKAKCLKIKIKNCSVMSHGKCKVCDNMFYVDVITQECKPCKIMFPKCNHCSVLNGEVNCRFCERGYFLPRIPKKKKKRGKKQDAVTSVVKPMQCAKCEDNCNHCDQKQCYICKRDFFYDDKSKKCKKCKIEFCEQCISKTECMICNSGYTFNLKNNKCEPCKGGCLRCSSEGRCYECPVDHFVMLHETIKNNNKRNILSKLLSTFLGSVSVNLPSTPITMIEYNSECLKECPKELDSKPVIINYAERKCVVKTTEKTQQMPLMRGFGLQESGSLYNEIDKIKVHYVNEINKIKKASLAKKVTTEDHVSSECFNNGLIKKIYRGNLASYYICRCLPGYLGDNCQLTQELHIIVQKNLLQMLDNIQHQMPTLNKHRYKEVLNTLISFNKFKIDEVVVTKIIEVLGFLIDRNHSLENKKLLYVLYDSLFLSVFDSMEDIKKKGQSELLVNFDAEEKSLLLQEKIKNIILLMEISLEDMDYAHSFLSKHKKEYVGLDTYSFIISEYTLRQNKFRISNPNIDSSFSNEEITNIELVSSNEDGKLNSKFNLQFIHFSIELLGFNFTDLNFELISNVLYFKFIDSLNPHIQVVNKNVYLKSIKMNVPLLTIPGYTDIKKHVFCLSFKSSNYVLGQTKGIVQDFDEDTGFLSCLYENIGSFTNTYFGVFIKKRDDLE